MLHLIDGMQDYSSTPVKKYEIYVASLPGKDLMDALESRNVSFIPLPWIRRPISVLDFVCLIHLIWIIRKHRFDIVHTNSSKPGFLGRIAATVCKTPLIVHTAHGTSFNNFQPRATKYLYMGLEAIANRLCNNVVFVNNADRILCENTYLVQPSKACTIYNALPSSMEGKLTSVAMARVYGANPQITIGSILRFSDQKNVIETISRICKVCKETKALRFIFIGDGEHLPLCRSIVQSHGLNDSILLPGWDSDVIQWLSIFDAFMLYSNWEGLPISIIEAMYSGLAVIGSDLDGILELVDDCCGYIVPLANPEKLEHCLLHISKNREELEAKGRQALISISEKCSFKQMMDGYSKIYDA